MRSSWDAICSSSCACCCFRSASSCSFLVMAAAMLSKSARCSLRFSSGRSKYWKNFSVSLMRFVRPCFFRLMKPCCSSSLRWSYALLVRSLMRSDCLRGSFLAGEGIGVSIVLQFSFRNKLVDERLELVLFYPCHLREAFQGKRLHRPGHRNKVADGMAQGPAQERVLIGLLLDNHVHLVEPGLEVVEEGIDDVGRQRHLLRLLDLDGGRHILEAEPDEGDDALGDELQLDKDADEAVLVVRRLREML